MTDLPGSTPAASPAPEAALPRTPGPVADGSGPDWTDQVTDLIVDTVDNVRSRTTGPLLGIARSSVYAVVILVILVPIVVVLLAGLVRLVNWALPGDVWYAYTLLGIVFVLAGVVCWAKRSTATT
jgi:hypothetical protein